MRGLLAARGLVPIGTTGTQLLQAHTTIQKKNKVRRAVIMYLQV